MCRRLSVGIITFLGLTKPKKLQLNESENFPTKLE